MNWPKLVHSVRSAAVFFVLAISLPAQKLSFLHSVDASSSATPGIAADSTGVYLVNLSGRHFVLHKFDPGGKELWTSESGEAHWITAMIAVTGGGIQPAKSRTTIQLYPRRTRRDLALSLEVCRSTN